MRKTSSNRRSRQEAGTNDGQHCDVNPETTEQQLLTPLPSFRIKSLLRSPTGSIMLLLVGAAYLSTGNIAASRHYHGANVNITTTSVLPKTRQLDATDQQWMATLQEQTKTINATQHYRHAIALEDEYKTLLLPLLRNLTNLEQQVDSPPQKLLPEPYVNEVKVRIAGHCKRRQCTLIWDGYARAMASGDILYDVLMANVPGAIAEVGVWRGGMSAYFQGILLATKEEQKRDLWLIDSFQGLPQVDAMTSSHDKSNAIWNSDLNQSSWAGQLAVGEKLVWRKLNRLGLLKPDNVKFLSGFIQDSLPTWGVSTLAFLRIDVDIYSATYDALHFLYPRLSVGGAILFDDWKFEYSREAILNYRKEHGIMTPIQFLSGCVDSMAYWIKEE
jgi:hypothetical protein